MSKLKNFFDSKLVSTISKDIHQVYSSFNKSKFEKAILAELDDLELKERARLIATHMKENLPEKYPDALKILLKSWTDVKFSGNVDNMSSFYYAPHSAFIERFGLEHWKESMDAMYELTKKHTAEFCIRPFIQKYPKETLKRLHEWTNDPSEHVRRLVSEGSRPRLPWSSRLPDFVTYPTEVLKLLEKLKEDESLYVRRSVANSLNDIAKDHSEIVVKTLRKWKDIKNEGTQWLIKHASRTLVKEGDEDAMNLLGFSTDVDVTVKNINCPKTVKMGDSLAFEFEIVSKEDEDVDLMIDYSVHFMKSRGSTSKKVFKLSKKTISAGGILKLKKTQSFKKITTRKYYQGQHHIEILVNGKEKAKFGFILEE